jgi:hypothetical protein
MMVLCAMLGGLTACFGPAAYFDWAFFKQESPGAELTLTLFSIPFALLFLWAAALNACRLFSPAPDAVIDGSGLALKPCMAPRLLAWTDITGSRVKQERVRGTTYTTLELDLARPQRRLQSGFLPSRKIRLASRTAAPVQAAARMVRHYRLRAGHAR